MKPAQAIGYYLLNTTAVTAITSTRINHGLRPVGTAVPSINYYEVGGLSRAHGMESMVYSVNCRSTTAAGARDLARLVMDAFIGTSSNGKFGDSNGFIFDRISLQNDGGLIPEPEDNIYNAPVDIRIVYTTGTVS